MTALVQYVKSVAASKVDGTIGVIIKPDEIATLTIKNKAIVAASIGNLDGKAALTEIKRTKAMHMEFWPGVTQLTDILKMVANQMEIYQTFPPPEDELFPSGADFSSSIMFIGEDESDALLNGEKLSRLTAFMTQKLGAKSKDIDIIIESAQAKVQSVEGLLRLLSEEVFNQAKDRTKFIIEANEALNKAPAKNQKHVLAADAKAGAKDGKKEDINKLNPLLAKYVGPAAKLVLADAQEKSNQIDVQLDYILNEINAKQDKIEFTQAAYVLLGIGKSKESKPSERDVRTIITILADRLGPVAELLVEDAQEKLKGDAQNMDDLLSLVSEELDDKNAQTDFLAEVYLALNMQN